MIHTDNQKVNTAMVDQPENPEPTSSDSDILTWGDLILWTVTPGSECTLDNPEYATFVKRFEASRFAGSMECPAGGLTLEQLVLASYQVPGAQEETAQ
jgi:hypothetical protein